jgi:osmotically-inducible protein OsmY
MLTTTPPISADEAFIVRNSEPDRRASGVAERARHRLRSQPYRSLRMIVCEYHHGLLTLRGVVNSFYLKQVAQAAVAGLDGVREISNRIEVRYAIATRGRPAY